MDVSKIDAISPQKIDWRKLTARDIIKFEKQGVEVPNQYLQWAKEFIQQVNSSDNDDTTYEMATSASANVQNQEQAEPNDEASAQTANEKRVEMTQNGADILTIGAEFRKESNTKSEESKAGESIVANIEQTSANKTESLDSEIDNLMLEADEIKSKIESIKNNPEKSKIGNIIRLREQLKILGNDAQSRITNVGADFNEYQQVLNIENTVGTTTQDYGNETVQIGKEITSINPLMYAGIGAFTRVTGEKAIEAGQELIDVIPQAMDKLQKNIDAVEEMSDEVKQKTGVSETDSEKGKSKEDDKSRTAGITETDKAATANLEQILQAKIRKGQETNS